MHKIIGLHLLLSVVALSQESSNVSSGYIWSFANGSGVSGDLSSLGSDKILNFAVCPAGLAVGGFVYISGEALTLETAPIKAASCPALTPGTVTITTSKPHAGAWRVSTSTSGLQEAINSLGSAGGSVVIPSGTFLVHSRITLSSNIALQGAGPEHTNLSVPLNEFVDVPAWQFGLTPSATVIFSPPGASKTGVSGLSITFEPQASPPNGSYGIIFVDTRDSIIHGVAVRNGPVLKDGNTFLPIGVLGLSSDNRVEDSFVYNQVCTISSEGAGGFIAGGTSNSFIHNYVSNGCNSSYVTGGKDTLFDGNIFELAASSMVADAQAFASDNGSGARFVNNTCIGNGTAPACFTAVTDATSPDTVNSLFIGNIARNCSEAYQFQSTLARSRGITVKGGSVTGCAVSVSIVGIVDKLWIDAVPGLRNVYSDRIYAINTSNGPNEDIETGDADSIWLSEASDRFSVGGLKGGWDGRQLEVVNATAQPATLSNNDSDASPGNRICTPVGADVTLASRDDFATLTYSATANCWVVSKLKPRPPQLTQIARDVIEIGANACDRDTQCVARSQFRCEAVCKNAIQLKNSAVKVGYFPGSREKMPVNFPPDD